MTSVAYSKLNKLFINGQWVDGNGSDINVINPYSGQMICNIKGANENDIDSAYKHAASAQESWSKLLYPEKMDVFGRAVQIMKERKKEFICWLIKESGSTKTKAKIEFKFALEALRYASTYPARVESTIVPSMTENKESRLYRRPLGVVGVISPWNFPLHLTVRSVAPAIALGNTVVLKPATNTPITGGVLFSKVMEQAGLPHGVLNVIVAKGKEIGDAFIVHKIPRLISFTGSTKMGQHIAKLCGENLKKVALELGGNGPFLVMGDADIGHAVDCALFGKFLHSGQICIAVNRFLVYEKIYDEFATAFVKRVAELKVGDPSKKDTLVGPLINKEQVNKIREWVKESVNAGAKVLYEGREVEGHSDNILPPIVLGKVTPDMPIAKNEVFGPVASLISVKDDIEMVQLANSTEYGLAASIQTSNLERGMSLGKKIEVGMVHINDCPIYDEPTAAFGGEKASGIGRFGGHSCIEEFTTLQWITLQQFCGKKYPAVKQRDQE
jgi:aldehyde dehydrogenase (NAD+)